MKLMETVLGKSNLRITRPADNSRYADRLLPLWEKWGIWSAIISCTTILFVFTDFGDSMRGMRDGLVDSGRKEPMSVGLTVGVLVTALFLLTIAVGLLSGISHLYYALFHRHVFKNNRATYTILYILLLILLWNFMSDGLAMLLDNYKGDRDKTKPSQYNDLLASGIASLLLIFMIIYSIITDFRKSQKQQLVLIQ